MSAQSEVRSMIKKMIFAHNTMLSVIVAECVSKIYEGYMKGWRFWLVYALIFLVVFRLAYDLLMPLYRKEIKEDERRARKTRGRNSVPGAAWHKVRLSDTEPNDRDTSDHLKTV